MIYALTPNPRSFPCMGPRTLAYLGASSRNHTYYWEQGAFVWGDQRKQPLSVCPQNPWPRLMQNIGTGTNTTWVVMVGKCNATERLWLGYNYLGWETRMRKHEGRLQWDLQWSDGSQSWSLLTVRGVSVKTQRSKSMNFEGIEIAMLSQNRIARQLCHKSHSLTDFRWTTNDVER
jgi:hypothetical protein